MEKKSAIQYAGRLDRRKKQIIKKTKKLNVIVEKAIELACDKYFMIEMTGRKQPRLSCLLLGMDFIILARLHTLLNGIKDPLQ